MTPLAEHQIHLWQLPVPDVVPAPFLDVLDDAEREVMRRYKRAEDARRFATGRVAVRCLLAAYLSRAASEITFDRTCRYCGADHGKPRVANPLSLDFNVSASGRFVLIGVARVIELGVDIEAAGDDPDHIHAWVCKEAVVKATGHGLAIEPSSITLSTDAEPVRVVSAPPEHAELLDLSIVRVPAPPGYAAAVAMRPMTHDLVRTEITLEGLGALTGCIC